MGFGWRFDPLRASRRLPDLRGPLHNAHVFFEKDCRITEANGQRLSVIRAEQGDDRRTSELAGQACFLQSPTQPGDQSRQHRLQNQPLGGRGGFRDRIEQLAK